MLAFSLYLLGWVMYMAYVYENDSTGPLFTGVAL